VSLGQYFSYLFYGIRFDISAVAYANALFTLLWFLPFSFRQKAFYKKLLFWSFLIPNILILAPNIADAFYYPFVFRRSTWDLLSIIFTMKSEIDTLWTSFFIDFWPAYFIFAVCIIIYIYVFKAILKNIQFSIIGIKTHLISLSILIASMFFIVIGMRGGFQVKPISLITASKYAPVSHTPLVLNSAFSIIRSYGKTGLEKKDFFTSEDEMYNYFSMCKEMHSTKIPHQNIVIIILESFSNEHFNSLNPHNALMDGVSFTPFLDSLIYEGFFFDRCFANGKRSIDGITAILSSIPSLMSSPFTLSPYAGNNFKSLPILLAPYGYTSSFYHGGQNGTMNFDSYCAWAGFDNYYGKDEYPEPADFDGKWGIWDEPYLQYVASMIDVKKEPFFATIFTLSSHHPYQVPEKYDKLLPQGPLPIHKAIAYTDLALSHFFAIASKSKWYNNTLFIITSDHSSEPYQQFYKEPAGLYSIPLLFFDPGNDLRGRSSKTCQQTDIMPSIMEYIGYSGNFTAYGNSVFDSTSAGMNFTFATETYQMLIDSSAVIFAEDNIVKAWNFIKDPSGTDPKHQFHPSSNILKLYLSFIQQYNNSIATNKMNCNFVK
jgi:phosphoglycerol transferase MdoB-like AlkP superfamily enzyme